MNRVRVYWERYVFNVGCRGVKDIYHTYARPSSRKVSSYDAIKQDCIENNGFMCSVITYSCHYYTAGYMFKKDGKLFFKAFWSTGNGVMELGPNEKVDAMQHGIL